MAPPRLNNDFLYHRFPPISYSPVLFNSSLDSSSPPPLVEREFRAEFSSRNFPLLLLLLLPLLIGGDKFSLRKSRLKLSTKMIHISHILGGNILERSLIPSKPGVSLNQTCPKSVFSGSSRSLQRRYGNSRPRRIAHVRLFDCSLGSCITVERESGTLGCIDGSSVLE